MRESSRNFRDFADLCPKFKAERPIVLALCCPSAAIGDFPRRAKVLSKFTGNSAPLIGMMLCMAILFIAYHLTVVPGSNDGTELRAAS
jgi:hypothetical protein